MTRTFRFCNKRLSPLFIHSFKFLRKRCRCSYCIDPKASKHRREKNKLEIRRELANLGLLKMTDFHYPCYEFHWFTYRNNPGNSCNMEVKLTSMREFTFIK